jgi:hypothetical protein
MSLQELIMKQFPQATDQELSTLEDIYQKGSELAERAYNIVQNEDATVEQLNNAVKYLTQLSELLNNADQILQKYASTDPKVAYYYVKIAKIRFIATYAYNKLREFANKLTMNQTTQTATQAGA